MGDTLMNIINADILDMSEAFEDLEQSIRIKTVTTTTVNFEKVQQVTARQQNCVVQSAEKDKLTVEQIDYSLEYLWLHSHTEIKLYELVEINSKDYKVITPQDWNAYGYCEVIAEEVKGAPKEVTA